MPMSRKFHLKLDFYMTADPRGDRAAKYRQNNVVVLLFVRAALLLLLLLLCGANEWMPCWWDGGIMRIPGLSSYSISRHASILES
jgi:hypothetical protein